LRNRQRGANQRKRQCEHKCKIDFRFHAYPICLAEFILASRVLTVTGFNARKPELPGTVQYSHSGAHPQEQFPKVKEVMFELTLLRIAPIRA
jgi:hypothetical protein